MGAGRVRLATRGSPQARTQAEVVAEQIRRLTGAEVELVTVETTGDQRRDVPLHVIGGQGVFVKEVQQAVLDGAADVAVHSAKDLPSTPHPDLVIGAFTPRRDPADALIGRALDDLADGATVATGSVRRRAQLAAVRPALSLATLAVGAASALRVERVFAIDGRGGEAAVFLAGVVGGNGMNNLPATVIALPALETHPERAWPLLLGVNLGATLWITGALSSLLWQSTTARLGAPVSARRYAAVGWRVGLPALAAALTVRLLLAG
ncbi:MAG: hypothetical protein H0U21_15090 [Acidimicrobiia bacterium]|nr:hypothetical protein [Acidimicrobiia bacterium]